NMLEGNQAGAALGSSVACAGDVNGDGFSDVIAGAASYSNGQANEGVAFIYNGLVSGISPAITSIVESNLSGSLLGSSVASAGDVNGDGYADVIVGAYQYSNGENNEGVAFIYYGSSNGLSTTPAVMVESNQTGSYFGYSVAGAGDVNGDGYSDVIVGAYKYSNSESNEGVAFVYHGSIAGLNTTAAAMVESNKIGAWFGYSVAGAGDVNGDGYCDVIVGSLTYNNGQTGEGAAFVYHGSATGINTTPAAMVEINQVNATLGSSVACAGDVNGDGYSDVMVGALGFSNGQDYEGAVFFYNGSASGIGTTAVAMVEGNKEYDFFGCPLAGAGDLNGDGYSDVIVGAYQYDLGNNNLGAAFIYYGSASGINTGSPETLAPNLGLTGFGYSVASAGDVNGDGYSDVVASDFGLSVLIFEGSASGINTTTSSKIDGSLGSMLGWSVAGAGDVNGDGFSDVIAGAPFYDNGETNEGAAFVYYSNSAGKHNNLDLYNTDLSTPINSSNFPGSTFGAGLYAKSIAGVATKGKLLWETAISYQSYSGTPITNSMLYTSMQSSYTPLGGTPVQFTNVMAKQSARYTKVRARVKYEWDAATAISGQVYGPWRYASDMAYLTLTSLPVNLISFKAAWLSKGKSAQLTFVTDNESDVCCYHIQKSSDGVNFTTIGTVASKNATVQTTYGFTDNNAVGPKL
ncbi:MAG TPA: FG-GAP-like repeat-containing protein, partial [Niastella sp.]